MEDNTAPPTRTDQAETRSEEKSLTFSLPDADGEIESVNDSLMTTRDRGGKYLTSF